jgi:hypothetical protein
LGCWLTNEREFELKSFATNRMTGLRRPEEATSNMAEILKIMNVVIPR